MLKLLSNSKRRIFTLMVALVLLVPLFSINADAKPLTKRIVKVGYYENDNFMSGASEDMVKAGYAYEYLQRLQVYSNWKYEYVYGEYGDLYKALVDGEIDMLPGLAYSKERLEYISYPELSMGETSYYFLKRTDDSSITNNPQSLNNKRIGTLAGSMKTIVDSFLTENNITGTVIEFEELKTRDASLTDGTTDVIIVEGEATKYIEGTEPFIEAGANSVYIAVAKNRPDLLEELNNAQDKLYEANPMLIETLNNTWYKQNVITSALSENEKNWYKNHHDLKVGYYTHSSPYISMDDNGKATGIVTEVIPEIFKKLHMDDINILYIGYESFEELCAALQNQSVDLICPSYVEYWSSEKNNISTTDPFINTYFKAIYKNNYPNMDNAVFALQKSNMLVSSYKEVNYPKNSAIYYDTIWECLDAVLTGEADVFIIGNYTAESLLKTKSKYSILNSLQLPYQIPLGFAVERGKNETLEVLNHGIWILDANYADSILYKYYETPKITFRDYISQNALTVGGVAVAASLLIIILSLLELRKKKIIFLREEKQKIELEEKVNQISDLNDKLRKNQWQLEDAVCQQEAQIEEITALNTELEDNQKQLENQIDIIRSMSKIYFCSYYIDVTNDSFVELFSKKNINDTVGAKGEAQKALNKMCDVLISPEYADKMREFSDLSTLDNRFKFNNVVTCEYIGVTSGWSQAYFIEGDRDENGRLLHTFFATRMIHVEKAREEEQKRILEEARETAEAANNAKTSFLFNMSHDIRTPMNAIMGFRDLLEKNQDDPEKRQDYLNKIDAASNVLLSIINNVLEMARIEKGVMTVEETAWSTYQFTETLFCVFEEMMKQKNILFTKTIDVEHDIIFLDPIKLREVFLNILSNAYKYTPEGGTVSLDVSELPCEIEGWVLYRTVITDTGIGMSEEFLPHIFDEFSRENNTTEARVEGTGLGMPIVKKLVNFMNGTIEVTSKKGEGSSFTITIPHRIATKDDLVEHMGVEYDPKLFEGKRVLLAEDNELNAEIATEILKEAGFIVDLADDGDVCVQMLDDAEAGYYNVILMDIQMPTMNGYEATRAIRTMADYEKANIPILAMTANAFEEDKKEAQRVGMDGHLAKPINVKQMLKELARVLTDM